MHGYLTFQPCISPTSGMTPVLAVSFRLPLGVEDLHNSQKMNPDGVTPKKIISHMYEGMHKISEILLLELLIWPIM